LIDAIRVIDVIKKTECATIMCRTRARIGEPALSTLESFARSGLR
jgi:hypothetical protein